MAKVLNPTVHGVLDYVLALAFLLAPGLVGFGETAANLSTVIGVVYLGASLLTQYPLGAIKMIPFPVHGAIESILAASWIVMPCSSASPAIRRRATSSLLPASACSWSPRSPTTARAAHAATRATSAEAA